MRSSRIESGTSRATMRLTCSPLDLRSWSSISACSLVRGNPSRINPFLQSASWMRSLMMPTTTSSPTSLPAFMSALALSPMAVLAPTAARSMSPVESCGMFSSSSIFGPCVPLPAPGGPKRIMILRGLKVASLMIFCRHWLFSVSLARSSLACASCAAATALALSASCVAYMYMPAAPAARPTPRGAAKHWACFSSRCAEAAVAAAATMRPAAATCPWLRP
mmetsp:Transcript_28219/g.62996  ORF Transcript_28219/g.62996 Transcript_28219/m.62996 type:complete len:221 (+) Transcript_28219:481-1143(+)